MGAQAKWADLDLLICGVAVKITIAAGQDYGATSSSDVKTAFSIKTSQESVYCSGGGREEGGKFITSGQSKARSR